MPKKAMANNQTYTIPYKFYGTKIRILPMLFCKTYKFFNASVID